LGRRKITNLTEILGKELDSTIILTEEELTEGVFSISMSPVVAFMTLKKKAWNFITDNPIVNPIKKAIKGVRNTAFKAGMKVETAKAAMGLSSGKGKDATVYKLQPEQRKFLVHLQEKYGNKIVEEISIFRTNIMAPYQIIKRSVAKNRSLTSKDINGMTKEEFIKYRESGRHKIERRENFVKDFDDKKESVESERKKLKEVNDALEDFKNGIIKDISNTRMNKVFKEMKIDGTNLYGFTPEEMQKSVHRIQNLKRDIGLVGKSTSMSAEQVSIKMKEMMDELADIEAHGYYHFHKKSQKPETIKNKAEAAEAEKTHRGSFKKALISYMLREKVRDELKGNVGDSAYRGFLSLVLKDEIKELTKNKDEKFTDLIKTKTNIELNKMEAKIWAPLPSNFSKLSGNINDYYQKIREEDFKDTKYYNLQNKPEIQDAENAINAEVKRFERELKKTITESEWKELKRLRLINRPITLKELKSSSELFKSTKDFKDDEEKVTDNYEEPVDGYDDTKDYITEAEYLRKIKTFINMKFNSFAELDKAKKQIKQYEQDADDDLADKYKDLVKQFMNRRSLIPVGVLSSKFDLEDDLVDIDDVENLANKILTRNYESLDDIKHDNIQLQQVIANYKKQHEKIADIELGKINMIIERAKKKIEGSRVESLRL
jgi:hypothetical protein